MASRIYVIECLKPSGEWSAYCSRITRKPGKKFLKGLQAMFSEDCFRLVPYVPVKRGSQIYKLGWRAVYVVEFRSEKEWRPVLVRLTFKTAQFAKEWTQSVFITGGFRIRRYVPEKKR